MAGLSRMTVKLESAETLDLLDPWVSRVHRVCHVSQLLGRVWPVLVEKGGQMAHSHCTGGQTVSTKSISLPVSKLIFEAMNSPSRSIIMISRDVGNIVTVPPRSLVSLPNAISAAIFSNIRHLFIL